MRKTPNKVPAFRTPPSHGAPCRVCGATLRYVNGQCVACSREHGKRYAAANPDRSAFNLLKRRLVLGDEAVRKYNAAAAARYRARKKLRAASQS